MNEPSTQPVDLYFDVVSPYAYLMDAVLRREGFSRPVLCHPVLFAGLLRAFGNKGPAEIESKREFTYEFCTWYGQQHGIPFLMPGVHPFNPLPYLRLIIALGSTPTVVSTVFDSLWSTGADPGDPMLWRQLTERLGVEDGERLIGRDEVKSCLRENTERAARLGVFGVPALIADERLFWGLEALPMARAWVRGDPVFSSPSMRAARLTPVGVRRRDP